MGIVDTQDSDAIKRQALRKIDERLLKLRKVVRITLHMVSVDIGNDLNHRRQRLKQGIGFIRFNNDKFTRAEPRVRARAIEPSANDESRIKPPSASALAIRLVVVVLPCVPATAMPCLKRISSASISARGTTGIRRARAASTSGLSSRTALDTTTAFAPSICAAS